MFVMIVMFVLSAETTSSVERPYHRGLSKQIWMIKKRVDCVCRSDESVSISLIAHTLVARLVPLFTLLNYTADVNVTLLL